MTKQNIFLMRIFLLFSTLGFSQEDWTLVKDKNEIKVYTKSEENSNFKSFKATTTLNCSVETFVFTILDIEHFDQWGYKIIESKLLERKGDTILIQYSATKAPFPFKNRDGIYKNTLRWNSEQKRLVVIIDVLPNYLPEDENYIRVKGSGYWRLISESENIQKVSFEMQVDPGGEIPSWLTNMFITDTPYTTLDNLKKLVERKKNVKNKYSFIN